MDIFGQIQRRDRKPRMENCAHLYKDVKADHPWTPYETVTEKEYKGNKYRICSGVTPLLIIAVNSAYTMSTIITKKEIRLKNRLGKEVNVEAEFHPERKSILLTYILLTYTYDKDGDYTPQNPGGKMYSEQDIVEDIKTFIDQIIQKEKEFIDYASQNVD